ncbi:MAG: hypothetical protein JNG89_07355 [Planctomycetaceae bacterium]|nr:hypothetical protein [Planctomycetaceae bacterium]
MPAASPKSVLFLCTGNHSRSRFAEILFNSVAARLQLGWRATSRGLALERGINNVGPMSRPAVKTLQTLAIQAPDDIARAPLAVSADDLQSASWIVALNDIEHRPLLQQHFPDSVERVEFWEIANAPQQFPEIEREVTDLAARLITGGRQRTAPAPVTASPDPPAATDPPRRKLVTAKVARETAGRRGKGVTIVDIPLDENALRDLAGLLKEKCGTGGTVKNGRIEIQGEQRERIARELERLGYKVKGA